MPGRNIHSLSLSMLSPSNDSTYDIISLSNGTTTGRNKLCLAPAQSKPSTGSPENSLNTSKSDNGHQHTEYQLPFTIFRRGQITPSTPSYFPTGVEDSNTKTGGILSPRMANAAVEIPEVDLDINTPDSPDDDFGFSLEEFEKRYVPLSHLPTPPLSATCSVDLQVEREAEVLLVDAEFWGKGPSSFCAPTGGLTSEN
jgi:hypothetical protein